MNDNKRRAIVWDLIEQSAFRPSTPGSWLRRYSLQLRNLLQLQPIWTKDGSHAHFEIAELRIACKYRIEGQNAYIVHLTKTEDERRIWSIHADADYLSKAALHMAEVDYPDDEVGTHLHSDITNVLDGMLFHPRNHTHLSYIGFKTAGDDDASCRMLKAENIRVSGSAYNGFVFLYHLAYQLCVVSKNAREDEKLRLINLFENSIKEKIKNVSARDLFDF